MLTVDLLKKQPHLSGLTEEQFDAISTLSKNDEEMVMKEKIGEWAGRIENDFLSASGIEKNPGEKYFDYIKRGAAKLKDNLSTAQGRINSLSKQIDDGKSETIDEVAKREIEEWKSKYKDESQRSKSLEADNLKLKEDFEAQLLTEKNNRLKMESDSGIKSALAGFKPKNGLSDELFNETVNNRLNRFYETYTPEKVKGTDGKEFIQYRNANGDVYTNPNNLQKPFSPSEVAKSLISDIVEEKRVQNGLGTSGKSIASVGANLTGSFRSKTEATSAFREYASKSGIVYGSKEFNDKYAEFRKVNNIDELPLQVKKEDSILV